MKAKARLVAKGYMAMYALTPSLSSIGLLSAHPCATDFPLYHLDAEQAFVQSDSRGDLHALAAGV